MRRTNAVRTPQDRVPALAVDAGSALAASCTTPENRGWREGVNMGDSEMSKPAASRLLGGVRKHLALFLTKEVRDELRRLNRAMEQLAERNRIERKWRKQIGQKIDALIRREYLADFLGGDYPFEANAKRFHLFSQNEEDGMIMALLQTAGVATRRFVEIGSGASGGNSGLLAQEFGWRGLMVDFDERKVAKCRARFGDADRVRCERREVTPDNIDKIISDSGMGRRGRSVLPGYRFFRLLGPEGHDCLFATSAGARVQCRFWRRAGRDRSGGRARWKRGRRAIMVPPWRP